MEVKRIGNTSNTKKRSFNIIRIKIMEQRKQLV